MGWIEKLNNWELAREKSLVEKKLADQPLSGEQILSTVSGKDSRNGGYREAFLVATNSRVFLLVSWWGGKDFQFSPYNQIANVAYDSSKSPTKIVVTVAGVQSMVLEKPPPQNNQQVKHFCRTVMDLISRSP